MNFGTIVLYSHLILKTSSTTHHPHGSNSKTKESAGAATQPAKEDIGFGICIKGNKSTGRGVLITKVEVGSPAYLAGLRGGDAILEINGTPFTHLHHEDAAKKCTTILKAEKFCSMTIRSPEMGTTMKYNSFDESQLMSHHQQQSYADDELYIPVPHHESAAADSGSIHSAPPLKVCGILCFDEKCNKQFESFPRSVVFGLIDMAVQFHLLMNTVIEEWKRWTV